LIGGKPIQREARPSWPGFSFAWVQKEAAGIQKKPDREGRASFI
jgi:hypothetical protein